MTIETGSDVQYRLIQGADDHGYEMDFLLYKLNVDNVAAHYS